MVSIVASIAIAVSAPYVLARFLPPQAPTRMAEPVFDAAAFYRAHPEVAGATRAQRSGGTARASQAQPAPIAGLDQVQMDNAFIVVEVGRQMQLPPRAYIVAIATALQESNLRNLANPVVPESLKYPHEGVGQDHDSVGIFQQRPSMGWGTVAQLMDPAQAAARFYTRLVKVGGWANLGVAEAAQAVQRSAFPTAYARHADRAKLIAEKMP
jgi:hypothetical protein